MDKLTFKQYCKEPAFPEQVSVSAFIYKDGSGDSVTRYSSYKGLTRLEYFTERAMVVLMQDALNKTLTMDGGFSSLQLADHAVQTARAVLWASFNLTKYE